MSAIPKCELEWCSILVLLCARMWIGQTDFSWMGWCSPLLLHLLLSGMQMFELVQILWVEEMSDCWWLCTLNTYLHILSCYPSWASCTFLRLGSRGRGLFFWSSVLMTCFYRDWSGFSWELPARDHVVKQYIFYDNIMECIYILAASSDSWHLMLHSITDPFHLGLEWEPGICYYAKVFIFSSHLQLLP